MNGNCLIILVISIIFVWKLTLSSYVKDTEAFCWIYSNYLRPY